MSSSASRVEGQGEDKAAAALDGVGEGEDMGPSLLSCVEG